MKRKTYIIADPAGLHAQPAARVVAAALTVESRCTLLLNGRRADLKAILEVMQVGANFGDEVILEVEGPDEESALLLIENALSK